MLDEFYNKILARKVRILRPEENIALPKVSVSDISKEAMAKFHEYIARSHFKMPDIFKR